MRDQLERQLTEAIGRLAVDEAFRALIDGESGPLLALIREGAPYLWDSPEHRETIALELEKVPRPKGRPKQDAIQLRNIRIVTLLRTADQLGIVIYGSGYDQPTACEILAEKFHLHPDTIKKIWLQSLGGEK